MNERIAQIMSDWNIEWTGWKFEYGWAGGALVDVKCSVCSEAITDKAHVASRRDGKMVVGLDHWHCVNQRPSTMIAQWMARRGDVWLYADCSLNGKVIGGYHAKGDNLEIHSREDALKENATQDERDRAVINGFDALIELIDNHNSKINASA